MSSRYVTITSLEELKKLGPTGVVVWEKKEPANTHWWDGKYSYVHYYLEQGAFTYLLEEDEESA